MKLSESRIRWIGYALLTTIFLLFFMQELFYTWSVPHILPKIFLVAIGHTIIIWEPTRYIILKAQQKWGDTKYTRPRILLTFIVLTAFACFVGFFRMWVEDRTNIWLSPTLNRVSIAWAMGVSLLFTLLELGIYEGIFLFRQWNKSREEAEQLRELTLQAQLESLKVQIQPHFLFNTLNTLIALVEEAPRPAAVKYTEEIAFVYRYLLVANERPMISLREEMKFTEAYLFLIKTRYPDGLHISLPADEQLNGYETTPLSMQILLENAVKHNIITTAHPLYIHITVDPLHHQLTVSNNLQRKKDIVSTGQGLHHLKRKFELLNLPPLRIEETAGTFSVTIPLRPVQEPAR